MLRFYCLLDNRNLQVSSYLIICPFLFQFSVKTVPTIFPKVVSPRKNIYEQSRKFNLWQFWSVGFFLLRDPTTSEVLPQLFELAL